MQDIGLILRAEVHERENKGFFVATAAETVFLPSHGKLSHFEQSKLIW